MPRSADTLAAPAPADNDLFADDLLARLRGEVDAAPTASVAALKHALGRGDALLADGFESGVTAPALVHHRAWLVDALLQRAWTHCLGAHADEAALVAVGGYGRGELLPHSDIDLLILHPAGQLDTLARAVETLIAFLWDIGLQVGHSVRTPAQCAELAAADVTIITNLVESRHLAGAQALTADMRARIGPARIWPPAAFFRAKRDEQAARHARYDETAYKLEPNIKESPGGLRDIQTIAWVAKRQFGATSLRDLLARGFLSAREYTELERGQGFLWRVRFALHTLTGRCEDRLLFDHQIQVARLFGYQDQRHNLAVEQFMQRYYRNIKVLSALNDLLLQLFDEAILRSDDDSAPTPLNARFCARHGYIEARHPDVFRQHPRALLEIFYLLETRPKLSGIRAQTLRLLRRDRHLIDTEFRNDIRNRRLFTEILRQRSGVTRALRRMNRYGVLGRYLPAFGRIIGRMQYDLFHTLTVDEHTLFVLRNLRRLRLRRFDHELPFASSIMQRLDKPELLYITALFHDIAKGRGGDHSELGAEDAAAFCQAHGISSADTARVCWLVRNHLLMSMTAQRKDINDPDVIYEFAREVGDQQSLDQLFVLTVSDIRGTNPNLWTSWKEALLSELYHNAARTLAGGLSRLDVGQLVTETRSAAAALLTRAGINTPVFKALWARFDDDYFLRHSAAECAWQSRCILEHTQAGGDGPLVRVDEVSGQGTTVFVHTRDEDYLFGLTTGVLAQLGVSILEARINATIDGYTLDSYMISDFDGSSIDEPRRHREIEQSLRRAIAAPGVAAIRVTRRPSRRARHFTVPTQISFRTDDVQHHTVMELITADRPGLLSIVGGIFRKYGLLVKTAKIGTIGERAEDVFHITGADHGPLTDPALLARLRKLFTRLLDQLQKNA